MPFSDFWSLLLTLDLAAVPVIVTAQGPTQSTQPASAEGLAAKGVQCPAEYQAVFDTSTKVLRCRRDAVAWVVTRCPEKDFATYSAKPGADSCGPTEIPGVGAPPGSTAFKPVGCAAPGYVVVVDRTGPRDRCERTERSFTLPRPLP